MGILGAYRTTSEAALRIVGSVQPLELRIWELEKQRERKVRNIPETKRAVRERYLAY